MHPPAPAAPHAVLLLRDIAEADVAALLARFGLELRRVADGAPIPGSYWGEPEAGIIGHVVHARGDTPVHSLLHEACHLVVLPPERRAAVHTDATDSVEEEDAVCVLQALLGDAPGVGGDRVLADMDAWGYTFRLGSARAYFERDADAAWACCRRAGWWTRAPPAVAARQHATAAGRRPAALAEPPRALACVQRPSCGNRSEPPTPHLVLAIGAGLALSACKREPTLAETAAPARSKPFADETADEFIARSTPNSRRCTGTDRRAVAVEHLHHRRQPAARGEGQREVLTSLNAWIERGGSRARRCRPRPRARSTCSGSAPRCRRARPAEAGRTARIAIRMEGTCTARHLLQPGDPSSCRQLGALEDVLAKDRSYEAQLDVAGLAFDLAADAPGLRALQNW